MRTDERELTAVGRPSGSTTTDKSPRLPPAQPHNLNPTRVNHRQSPPIGGPVRRLSATVRELAGRSGGWIDQEQLGAAGPFAPPPTDRQLTRPPVARSPIRRTVESQSRRHRPTRESP